jgi:hypothetical protein
VRVSADKTGLYAGPSNLRFQSIAELPKDTKGTPLGVYGDFVKVRVTIAGNVQTGFVPAKLLSGIPAKLPQLKVDQVPWFTSKNYTTKALTENNLNSL